MPIQQLQHPLVHHHIGKLRSSDASIQDFRHSMQQLGRCLAYKALSQQPLMERKINTWQGEMTVKEMHCQQITLVPILRAGLGLLDAVVNMVPEASVSMLGLYRNPDDLTPVAYFDKTVTPLSNYQAWVLDPMLATGGSMIAALDHITSKGCCQIKALVVLAAEQGIDKVLSAYPETELIAATIDPKLNDKGYIVPGLGDAGDRLFGTY